MSTSNVKAARRTLDLVEVFSAHRTPLSLTELATEIGAPKTSCFELLQTLKAQGYLYALGRRRGFYPTKRLFDHARAIAENDPVLGRIGPALAALRDTTGETILLGQRQNNQVVYLDVVEGRHSIRYSAQIGDHKPLHSSAIGKALLGLMKDEELDTLLRAHPLPRITSNTITDPAKLLAEVKTGRTRGYFVTRGENVTDVTAVAAIVRLHGEPFGIAVAGPTHRMEPDITAMTEKLMDVISAGENAL